jgi:hypothetical protein
MNFGDIMLFYESDVERVCSFCVCQHDGIVVSLGKMKNNDINW